MIVGVAVAIVDVGVLVGVKETVGVGVGVEGVQSTIIKSPFSARIGSKFSAQIKQ